MIKKILFCAVAGVILGLGWHVYTTLRNTPERVADSFLQALSDGSKEKSYSYLTPSLTKDREQYWKDYVGQFRGATWQRVTHDFIRNDFNAYASANQPQRFVYELNSKGRTFQMTMILVKQGKNWRVAELYGSDM